MKIERLSFLLFLSLSLGISSCKKDNKVEAGSAFPHKLYVTQLTQKSGVKVYTSNGEITDAGIIQKFLGQQQNYFNRTLVPGDTSSMTFINNDVAMFGSSTIKFAVTSGNQQLLFTSPQVVTVLNPNSLLYLLLKYTAPLSAPISNSSGTQYLTSEVRVGYGDYTSLKLSMLSYKLTSRSNTLYSMNAAVVYNEFNNTVISQLKANDTLAVQESFLTLKSK